MDAQIRNSRTDLEKLIITARSGANWKSYPGLFEIKKSNTLGKTTVKYILPLSNNLALWIYAYSDDKYSLCIYGSNKNSESILEERVEEPFYDSTIFVRRILIAPWDNEQFTPRRATSKDVQVLINWAIFTYAGCDAYEVCYLGLSKIKATKSNR